MSEDLMRDVVQACRRGDLTFALATFDAVGVDAVLSPSGARPVLVAAVTGQLELLSALKIRGADFSVTNEEGWGSFVHAAWGGHLAALDWLVDNGPAISGSALKDALSCRIAGTRTMPPRPPAETHAVLERLVELGAYPDDVTMKHALTKFTQGKLQSDDLELLVDAGGVLPPGVDLETVAQGAAQSPQAAPELPMGPPAVVPNEHVLVRVRAGIFAGQTAEAVYDSDGEHVRVWGEIFGRKTPVQIPVELVELIPASADRRDS